MSGPSDFIIENGVLRKYVGPGGDVVVPEGVTGIGDWAFFRCSRLTSVTLPEGVRSIGEGAFWYCTNLTGVTLPESLTSIGKEAFFWCCGLTGVTLPEGVKSIGVHAFSVCISLTSIRLPQSVMIIGAHAFYACSSLTSVTLSEGVFSIGERAFNGCSSLTSVALPESLRSVGEHLFFKCANLTKVYAPGCSISDMRKANCLRPAVIGFSEMVLAGRPIDPGIAAGYRSYLNRQRKRLYEFAAQNDSLLRYMMREAIIPPEDIETCIALTNRCGKIELTALLLRYAQDREKPDFRLSGNLRASPKADPDSPPDTKIP